MKYKIIKTSSLLQKYLIELQKYIIERNEFSVKDKIIQSHNICSSLDNFIPYEPVPTFISFKYFKFMNDFINNHKKYKWLLDITKGVFVMRSEEEIREKIKSKATKAKAERKKRYKMSKKEITDDDIKKAVEFAINRVCYNQENSTWARLMIENLLTNSPNIKEPMGYIQGGLILGYTMRYLEVKEKGFKNK